MNKCIGNDLYVILEWNQNLNLCNPTVFLKLFIIKVDYNTM